MAAAGETLSGGTTATVTTEEWSYGDQWRSVTYSPAGHLVYDEGVSSSSAYTLVNYLTRTWARQPGLGRPAARPAAGSLSGPRDCWPGLAAGSVLFRFGLPGTGSAASSLPSTVASSLRTAVSCGTLAVAGRQRVDGVEAIELTSRPGSPVAETIWVSPGTYLPLRAVIRPAPGAPGLQQTADITWLPPTARNLARLTVPIPAGFRHVPLAKAVTAMLPQLPPQVFYGALPASTALCPSPAGPGYCGAIGGQSAGSVTTRIGAPAR